MTQEPRPFAGTADDYLKHRPAYPDDLLGLLRARAKTTPHGTLLDLACGPGRIAIPMAPYFERVLAVDIEAEMIGVAEAEARRRGVSNIEWRVDRAEDLQLAPHSLELIAIGEAFHRLDQARVLNAARLWLRRGGAIASLGGEPVWRGHEPWKRFLVRVVNEWTDGVLGDPNTLRWGGPLAEFHTAGFRVEEHESAYAAVWTCDSIVGFMRSTSIASARVLGVRGASFEADLRRALLALEPSGRFTCTQRFGFTLGVIESGR